MTLSPIPRLNHLRIKTVSAEQTSHGNQISLTSENSHPELLKTTVSFFNTQAGSQVVALQEFANNRGLSNPRFLIYCTVSLFQPKGGRFTHDLSLRPFKRCKYCFIFLVAPTSDDPLPPRPREPIWNMSQGWEQVHIKV